MRCATTKLVRALHHAAERRLECAFGLHIDGAGAVVEDQDGGLAHQGAGNGQPLLLPAGEVDPPLPQIGGVSLGQTR